MDRVKFSGKKLKKAEYTKILSIHGVKVKFRTNWIIKFKAKGNNFIDFNGLSCQVEFLLWKDDV